MKQMAFIGLMLLALSGCGSKHVGEAFTAAKIPVSKELGTVVFYRPDQSFWLHGPGWSRFAIAVDGERVTGVGEKTYTYVQMPAGKHKFNTLTPNADTLENVDIKAGQIQYFRVYPTGYSFWKFILIQQKTEQEAMAEISGMPEQINPDPWIKKVIEPKS